MDVQIRRQCSLAELPSSGLVFHVISYSTNYRPYEATVYADGRWIGCTGRCASEWRAIASAYRVAARAGVLKREVAR